MRATAFQSIRGCGGQYIWIPGARPKLMTSDLNVRIIIDFLNCYKKKCSEHSKLPCSPPMPWVAARTLVSTPTMASQLSWWTTKCGTSPSTPTTSSATQQTCYRLRSSMETCMQNWSKWTGHKFRTAGATLIPKSWTNGTARSSTSTSILAKAPRSERLSLPTLFIMACIKISSPQESLLMPKPTLQTAGSYQRARALRRAQKTLQINFQSIRSSLKSLAKQSTLTGSRTLRHPRKSKTFNFLWTMLAKKQASSVGPTPRKVTSMTLKLIALHIKKAKSRRGSPSLRASRT